MSDLGVFVGLTSPIAFPISTAPLPLLSLALFTILLVVEPLSAVQLPVPKAGPFKRLLLVSILLLVDLSGLPIMTAAAIGLLSSALLPMPLMLATIMWFRWYSG